MKKQILLSCALAASLAAGADSISVQRFSYLGPHTVYAPFGVDSLDVNGKAFDPKQLLDYSINLTGYQATGGDFTGILPVSRQGYGLHQLGFAFDNAAYTRATIRVEGSDACQVFLDGEKVAGEVSLTPATHTVCIKCLTREGEADTLRVSVVTPDGASIAIREDGKRHFALTDVSDGTRCSHVSVSPDGKYLIARYRCVAAGGNATYFSRVKDLKTGRTVAERNESLTWMPRSNRYYFTCQGARGRQLVTVDPATREERVWAEGLPKESFVMGPSEDYLIFFTEQEGPKERKEIYQVLDPDDRQPGWRNRSSLMVYDLTDGVMQPLTHAHRSCYLYDLSRDGRYALIGAGSRRLEKRPTSLSAVYLMDLYTRETQLLAEDGFLQRACFSPDGKQVLFSGTPEAFEGIGKQVPEGRIPSMTEGELFLMDLATREIKPLTRDFNPSVQSFEWSRFDGMVYLSAENRDRLSLFQLDPETGATRLIGVPEDYIKDFAVAAGAPVMVCCGQAASNADRIYTVGTKKLNPVMVEDLNAEVMRDVEIGECRAWTFVNQKGDTIQGRYYLPPHFDASKKYPMIVNYYGGCSPTTRMFDTRYPQHLYAAMGYVVYVLDPSGATGYGQEFASRHVNTAGKGVAEDIIQGTKQFCAEHPFVDEKKIGCIGASYGGFMTQYLQTQTDIFAAAVSHAGISDHTSYWGFGYWGYSYSEVSMANSYPWTRKDLYVDQSPLYMADKIHTPLLFVHGDQDHNVPFAESVQLFTALKLLGRETALVAVSDQDHHILDYKKRELWQNTIFAWFAKYLQGNDSWWEAMYPKKEL